jgi:hypothetical protein
MSSIDPYHLSVLLDHLAAKGVQLWHNRGRLYYGPRDRLSEGDCVMLAAAKDDLVERLRREPMPLTSSGDLVAPLPIAEGSYAGRMVRRPWDYEVAVVLPTFGPINLLETAVACWRNQTVSPYLVVVHTGAPTTDPDRDPERYRSFDCEVHYLGAHGWRHSSSPVAAALDLAFAVLQTPAALLTHVDVFPKHEKVLENLLDRLAGTHGVVGYQMSMRHGSTEWADCVSHTLTMVDMRVMRHHRLTWNLLAALEADDEVEERYLGWPDTETWFGRGLPAAGIVPTFLAGESNAPLYETDLIVHWRSAPSLRHYRPDEEHRRHPGLGAWLQATRQLGHAAPLPASVDHPSPVKASGR